MKYKVVPFSCSVSNKQGAAALAAELESLIDKWTTQGWDYVGIEQLQTFVAGSSGCFGVFGATQATTVNVEFVVFKK